MTNGAKILITIAIIITLGIVIHGKIKNNAENVKENKSSNSDIMRYFDEEENANTENNNINTILQNNINNAIVENNIISNNTITTK